VPKSVSRDPFSGAFVRPTDINLRTLQARVLAALQPANPSDPRRDWPTYCRAQLSARAGYTTRSGSLTRALNGVRFGSSSGDPHPGLLIRGFVEEETLDIDGVKEVSYRATPAGVRAYRAWLESRGGKLPKMRDAEASINRRYRGGRGSAPPAARP
jgi:hypothetical protein